ncbi:MAG TPA: hypothetical protein VGG05_12970 [Pseudonocardiaceae bacterium]|jgi:hypothetical protein
MPPVEVDAGFGISVAGLDLAGLSRPLSLRVPIGRVRAVVIGKRSVAHAVADAVTGVTPRPDQVTVTGPAGGRVRLVPSDGALLPHLTVLENILSTPGRHRRIPDDVDHEVRAKAAGFGLDGLLDRHPHEIPAGRRRMTGLARALRARPDALVLEDEADLPTWGALLASAWRGYQVRPGPVTHAEPRTPDLLGGVATLLIVPSRDRALGFDSRPLVSRGGTGDHRRAD